MLYLHMESSYQKTYQEWNPKSEPQLFKRERKIRHAGRRNVKVRGTVFADGCTSRDLEHRASL